MNLEQLFDLESHGSDTFVGVGPRYPWGGLYGGQIVAQALRAAAATIDPELQVHSLRAYFIRRGDHSEPIRFEVDRIRNGRSFATRRVVARQAIGAILNLEASFQIPEGGHDLQTVQAHDLPGPDSTETSSWSESFDRRWIATPHLGERREGTGRVAAWMKVAADLGDNQLLHRCWLSYLSDDLPTDAVREAYADHLARNSLPPLEDGSAFFASLDHTIWFHRPLQADQWHLHDFSCHGFIGGRGLAIGHIFDLAGVHVATVAQEVLMRPSNRRQTEQHGS
jgi:acyl-CoA thioesterase II